MEEQKQESAPLLSRRDRMRAKAFANRRKSKVVVFEGERYLVTEPTGAAHAGITAGEHPFSKVVRLLIGCVFECDETDAPVRLAFEATDYDAMMQLSPLDPFVESLATALNGFNDLKKLEAEATKRS